MHNISSFVCDHCGKKTHSVSIHVDRWPTLALVFSPVPILEQRYTPLDVRVLSSESNVRSLAQ